MGAKDKFSGLDSLKTKSIFSISSFGSNNQNSKSITKKGYDLNVATNKKVP